MQEMQPIGMTVVRFLKIGQSNLSEFWTIPLHLITRLSSHYMRTCFGEHVGTKHVSCRPKRIVGSWALFLTAEYTEWVIFDTPWVLIHVQLPHSLFSSHYTWWWVTPWTPTSSIYPAACQWSLLIIWELGWYLAGVRKNTPKMYVDFFGCI